MGQWVFFAYRERISQQFAQLFDGSGGSSLLSEKWGWYSILYALAQGNPLDIEKVTELKMEQAFTYLCYEQDKNRMNRGPEHN